MRQWSGGVVDCALVDAGHTVAGLTVVLSTGTTSVYSSLISALILFKIIFTHLPVFEDEQHSYLANQPPNQSLPLCFGHTLARHPGLLLGLSRKHVTVAKRGGNLLHHNPSLSRCVRQEKDQEIAPTRSHIPTTSHFLQEVDDIPCCLD
ncbi:hypothetical protein NP233_g3716 [Leucocoprinus birnbaumii]|uniref:Uncharacterized protein n=1 Tax=Leucocoprinus birnbaumii TaxID=56174 RepID=A0AAD5YY51_9AGAR|nr:hypothetical protein NP233_g3716 [Leucocoprinus birnbaumii]